MAPVRCRHLHFLLVNEMVAICDAGALPCCWQRWARGFEVAEALDGNGYRLRRISDGSVLPAEFAADDVRAERKKQGLWWA